MSFARDIARTWRAPRTVMAARTAAPREGRSLAYLITACVLIWVAQWPRLSRHAAEGGDPLMQAMVYEGFAWVMVWPLLFYCLATVAGWIARAPLPRARAATFWALLAATPGVLFYGLTRGFVGDAVQAQVTGVIWVGAFVLFWWIGLGEARRDL